MTHLDLITDQCFDVVATCLRHIDPRDGIVLAGGWAVYAHAPSIPSIDTDLIVEGTLPSALRRALAEQGVTVGPRCQVEPIQRGERFGYWAFGEADLGVEEPGFEVADLLADRTRTVPLPIREETLHATVPEPAALALMKTCALHNRDLVYHSFYDGKAGMEIGPDRRPMLHGLPQSYYLRKAGKDLFDLSLLLGLEDAQQELWHHAERFGLQEVLPQIAGPLADAVRASATDLAAHAGTGNPFQAIQAALANSP